MRFTVEALARVPPAYAYAWYTDFKESDMRLARTPGRRRVMRLPNGEIDILVAAPWPLGALAIEYLVKPDDAALAYDVDVGGSLLHGRARYAFEAHAEGTRIVVAWSVERRGLALLAWTGLARWLLARATRHFVRAMERDARSGKPPRG
ncbi:MAG TPA: hypothetical protein VM889_12880 [Candidatus Thermoplasmatota archaeon]|nr:hypothetical protein [Candidatus Thermoplasmatota archaeon]